MASALKFQVSGLFNISLLKIKYIFFPKNIPPRESRVGDKRDQFNLQSTKLENFLFMNSIKRQKDRTLKDELPSSVDVQYATGEERKNNSRKNKETEPKQNQHPVWI